MNNRESDGNALRASLEGTIQETLHKKPPGSLSPVRGELNKGHEKNNILFRTPNPPKTKVVNLDALNSNSARL